MKTEFGSRQRSPEEAAAEKAFLANHFRPKLLAPKAEKAWVKGVRLVLLDGNLPAAQAEFSNCLSLDRWYLSAYFLGAYCSLHLDQDANAVEWLEPLVASDDSLPDPLMIKYGIDGQLMTLQIPMPITPQPLALRSCPIEP